LLPGTGRADLESLMATMANGLGARSRIDSFETGYESVHDGPLFESIQAVMARRMPAAAVVPFISSGGSDGRHLVDLCDVIYGFSPVLPDLTFDRAISMVHGVDERISADSLWFGTEVMKELLHERTRPNRDD
jgi:acetylornithine deacetylase/succinyl-diaminopimelate desuccinylase-like protein